MHVNVEYHIRQHVGGSVGRARRAHARQGSAAFYDEERENKIECVRNLIGRLRMTRREVAKEAGLRRLWRAASGRDNPRAKASAYALRRLVFPPPPPQKTLARGGATGGGERGKGGGGG